MAKNIDITGIESVVFGIDNFARCRMFLGLYGLQEKVDEPNRSVWESLDGSSVELRHKDDRSLPPALIPGPTGRHYIWGVRRSSVLAEIAAELGTDRAVAFANEELTTTDDDGHTLTFRVTRRHAYAAGAPQVNIAGMALGRRVNQRVTFQGAPRARAMGHVVFWSRDPVRSMDFYVNRLGFRLTDEICGNGGVFLRAFGHNEHHSVFFINIQHRPFLPSLQHLEFHFGDMHEVLMVGDSLLKAGFETGFGPGRHVPGSNWYWYFRTPLGCALEVAADMDHADDDWEPHRYKSFDDTAGWSLNYTQMTAMQIRDARIAAGKPAG